MMMTTTASFSSTKYNNNKNNMMMMIMTLLLSTTLPSLVSSAILGHTRREYPNQRSVKVTNMGRRRIDVFWINANDGSLVTQSEDGVGYPYGADTSILSYVGHQFLIKEMPGKKSGQCVYEECRSLKFTVEETEEQEVLLNGNFQIEFTDATQRAEQRAQRLLDDCNNALMMEEETTIDDDPMAAIDRLSDCMSEKINNTLAVEEEEREFQSRLRNSMAEMIPSYACGDPDFEASLEDMNRTWHYETTPGRYREHLMKIYHERPTSKIFTIPNFVSQGECMSLESQMNNNNQVPFTSVNGKSGDSKILHAFASRLYELARITLNWQSLDFQDQFNQGSELFEMYQDDTIIDLPGSVCKPNKEKEDGKKKKDDDGTSTVTIDSNGQQVITTTKTDDDESTAEEEKSCRLPGASPLAVSTTKFEASGSDVATIFLFCNKPKSLGAIHFPRAGVHIDPEVGTAVIAVHRYLNNHDNYDGFTQEYHMCPHHHIYKHTFKESIKTLDQ